MLKQEDLDSNIKMLLSKRVIFLDLDDTLIKPLSDSIFPKGIYDMSIKFDVWNALKYFYEDREDVVFCIVSNQGGIQKGFLSAKAFRSKISYISSALEEYTGVSTYSNFCSTNDPADYFRKPNTGMLDMFISDLYELIEPSDCLLIGDASGKEGQFSDSDFKTALNFGCSYLDVDDFVETARHNNEVHSFSNPS